MPRNRARVADEILEPVDSSVLDLLDRLLEKGVLANGDLVLGVAGVDLIYVRLSALLCASDRVFPAPSGGRSRRAHHDRRTGRRR